MRHTHTHTQSHTVFPFIFYDDCLYLVVIAINKFSNAVLLSYFCYCMVISNWRGMLGR